MRKQKKKKKRKAARNEKQMFAHFAMRPRNSRKRGQQFGSWRYEIKVKLGVRVGRQVTIFLGGGAASDVGGGGGGAGRGRGGAVDVTTALGERSEWKTKENLRGPTGMRHHVRR